MKALSIRQPWAWAIIHAGKDIENRTWFTKYRGPVLIHAAKGMTIREYVDFKNSLWNGAPYTEAVLRAGDLPPEKDLLRGGIVGKARIVDCVTRHSSPWFFGRFGFVLADVEPLPFTPLRGALGFFDIDEAVLAHGSRKNEPAISAIAQVPELPLFDMPQLRR